MTQNVETNADDRLDFGKYSELRNHEMLFNVQSTQQPQLRVSDGGMMGGDGAVSAAGVDTGAGQGSSSHHNKSSDNSYPNAGISAAYQQQPPPRGLRAQASGTAIATGAQIISGG